MTTTTTSVSNKIIISVMMWCSGHKINETLRSLAVNKMLPEDTYGGM